MPNLERSLFLKEVKACFPELISEINNEQGLLHLEMKVICKFTQDLIDKRHQEKLQSCFILIEKYYMSGNHHLKNAIDVSFIEPLNFKTTKKNDRRWAWKLLPDSLKKLYTQFHVDVMKNALPNNAIKR